MAEFLQVCSFWKRRSKSTGEVFYGSSELDKDIIEQLYALRKTGISLLLFKNEDKKSDKHPDLRLVFKLPEGEQIRPEQTPPLPDDDIPF